jgi:hypothetical protein
MTTLSKMTEILRLLPPSPVKYLRCTAEFNILDHLSTAKARRLFRRRKKTGLKYPPTREIQMSVRQGRLNKIFRIVHWGATAGKVLPYGKSHRQRRRPTSKDADVEAAFFTSSVQGKVG